MNKKIGIVLVFFALIGFGALAISESLNKMLSILLLLICFSFLFLGISIITSSLKNDKRNLLRKIYLAISLSLVGLALAFILFELPAVSILLILGVLIYCFSFAPLELQRKYLKWKSFSESKFETLLLSSLDFLGINFIALGILFKFMHWPYAGFLMYLGVIIISVGLIFWNYRFKKEVVSRKLSEDKLKEQHKEITDSINYAKRLQDAILPKFSEVDKFLNQNFILFKPKDKVSGDFYWFEQKNNLSLIAAADCTGHGVPGAMVSIVCSNALHRSVNEFNKKQPNHILEKTRELVIETFTKSGDDVKDGMDISLCAITDKSLIFSGANNPLWIIRATKLLTQEQLEHRSTFTLNDFSLIEFKADKQPVGLYEGMKPFTQIEIELFSKDTLYLFTDGFPDQFGGIKGKKYKYKPFKKLLLENFQQPMLEQKEILLSEFNSWKGENEQIDDVCIIGIQIN